jgi:hypothetical protein
MTTRASIRVAASLGVFVVVFSLPVRAASEKSEGQTAITIYSTAAPGAISPDLYRPTPDNPGARGVVPGYAVVRQDRDIHIAKERDMVRFTDVAAFIDPTTVTFASLTDAEGTHVLDQSFQFDLVGTAKLMEKYIDKEVTVEQVRGDKVDSITGTLLSTSGGLVLRRADGGIQVVTSYSNVRFPELPGGLITRPTLVWDVATGKPGAHQMRVTYQTTGVTWWADYNVVFSEGKDANSGVLDFGAWVSIINQSGATYPAAKLKLIAGDVPRAPQPMPANRRMYADALGGLAKEAKGFEEKSFFEYHLYTLGRPATLPDNSTKQIELFPTARNVPCEKVLVYYGLPAGFGWFSPDPAIDRNLGTQANKKVDIYLRFKNAKEIGMGMPLPSGRIRVSKMDPADKSLEFIGEDTIDHTPKDEEVLIKMGSAFDVVGDRRQIDFTVDTNNHKMEETIEVTLKSTEFEKVDSRTVHFPVEVPKDGEAKVQYTVRYTW